MVMTVLAAHRWPTNGYLIEDVARLGYICPDDIVVDATYGLGRFWTRWAPHHLIAHDLDPTKGDGVDLRDLPHPDASVDVVVLDPPYKLNGTPALGEFDARYGVDTKVPWVDRLRLQLDGITEASRVLRRGGRLLLKTQDQVVSRRIRWFSIDCTNHARTVGLDLVDRFDMLGGGRPQPEGRRQEHAQHRPSSLLVFRKVPL
jgi:hypothetical protein